MSTSEPLFTVFAYTVYGAVSPAHRAWLPSFAVGDLIVPTIFLLAGVSAFWKHSESKAIRWITAAVVLIVLVLVMPRPGLGWRPIARAAGVLISAVVFIFGSLLKPSSSIAAVGVISYAILQGDDLYLGLKSYWALGGSFQLLLTILIPPTLVLCSLGMAVTSHIKLRASTANTSNSDGSAR